MPQPYHITVRLLSRHPCIPPISGAGLMHPTNQRTAREKVVASPYETLGHFNQPVGKASYLSFLPDL